MSWETNNEQEDLETWLNNEWLGIIFIQKIRFNVIFGTGTTKSVNKLTPAPRFHVNEISLQSSTNLNKFIAEKIASADKLLPLAESDEWILITCFSASKVYCCASCNVSFSCFGFGSSSEIGRRWKIYFRLCGSWLVDAKCHIPFGLNPSCTLNRKICAVLSLHSPSFNKREAHIGKCEEWKKFLFPLPGISGNLCTVNTAWRIGRHRVSKKAKRIFSKACSLIWFEWMRWIIYLFTRLASNSRITNGHYPFIKLDYICWVLVETEKLLWPTMLYVCSVADIF